MRGERKMDRKKLLEETELFVLDMDGTFYLDTQILDGSLDFLRQVERLGKRYVFFTNNSSKSPKTYIDKLANMDCYIQRDQIITSGDVMIEYLKEYYPGKTVYLVGTPDLEEISGRMGSCSQRLCRMLWSSGLI